MVFLHLDAAFFLAVLLLQYAGYVLATYTVHNLTIPVDVSTNVTKIAMNPPLNQIQLTGLLQDVFSATSNVSQLQTGTAPLQASYCIFGQLYVPNDWKSRGTGVLEFAIHGLNLDHTYWSIGGPGSLFNYVESSVKAGNAIFVFDRLGSGSSSKPDGIKEVQTSVHIAVTQSLLSFLRRGVQGFAFDFIVGVGHSYGSFLLAGLAAKNGNAVDALVLTGFTTSTQAVPVANAALGMAIASQVDKAAFGSLSNSYMAIANPLNLQQAFLRSPSFPAENLAELFARRGIFTIGEMLTRGQALQAIAPQFTNPVFVVTGDKDIVECGGNCFQSVNSSDNLLDASRSFFPRASRFDTFIPADTGHCLHAHLSAPQSYSVIHEWIRARAADLAK